MRKLLVLGICACAAAATAPLAAPVTHALQGRVTEVIDGNRLWLQPAANPCN